MTNTNNANTTADVVECPQCQGGGEVQTSTHDPRDPDVRMSLCPLCGGEERVPLREATTYLRYRLGLAAHEIRDWLAVR